MLTAWFLISMGHALVGVSAPSQLLLEPTWNSSVQMGAGSADGASVGLVLPRLGIRSEFAELQLSVPLWLSSQGGQTKLVSDENWGSAHTYVSMIESLLLTSAKGNIRLRLGTLHQESLGSGVLVDGYSGSWDPLSFGTGAVTQIRVGGFGMKALVNRIDRPNFLAVGAQIMPLWWLGDADARRFVLTGEIAADKSPPTMPNKEALVVGDFGARLVFHSGQFFQVEGILSGVALHGSRFGAHLALLVEWLENAPILGDSVAVQIDLINGWAEYEPSYFGPLYDIQRCIGRPDDAAPYYGQLKINSKNGPVRYGLKTLLNFEGRVDLDIYAQVMKPRWSFMALFHQSGIGALRHLGQANSASWGEMEVAVTVYQQLYTYGQLVRGWHFYEPTTPTPLMLWTLGVGMHFGGKVPAT